MIYQSLNDTFRLRAPNISYTIESPNLHPQTCWSTNNGPSDVRRDRDNLACNLRNLQSCADQTAVNRCRALVHPRGESAPHASKRAACLCGVNAACVLRRRARCASSRRHDACPAHVPIVRASRAPNRAARTPPIRRRMHRRCVDQHCARVLFGRRYDPCRSPLSASW